MSHLHLVELRDGLQLVRQLHQQADPAVAVAAVQPSDRRRRLGRLAERVLEAVGVSGEVSGIGRNATEDWHTTHLQLAARDIDHLVVIDAHQLDGTELQKLAELAAATRTALWLLMWPDHLTAEHTASLAAWPTTTVDPQAFTDRFLTGDRPGSDNTADRRQMADDAAVRVPASAFVTFRADARRLLDDDAFAAVDRRFRAAHGDARRLADNPDPFDEQTVFDHLGRQLDGCATVDQMLTTVRAIQAALLPAGWYLQIDLDAFLGAHARPMTAAARSPETWRRLTAYRQPHRQAACALAAAGLSLQQMRKITLADVQASCRAVTVDGRQVPVEPPARPALRLQLLARRAAGAAGDALLMADAGGPYSDTRLSAAITDPATEVGVALINGQVVRRTVQLDRWARRQGISLQQV